MKAQCLASVSSAIGRSLTVAESRNIETRIRDAMRLEARRDPAAWQALSIGDRLKTGADLAAKEIVQEADLKAHRVALTIQTHDRLTSYLDEQIAKGYDDIEIDALDRTLAAKSDGKNNITSVESNMHGIEAVAMSQLVDTWEAISPSFMGLFHNRELEDAFIRQVHGTDTGIPEIQKGASKWLEATDSLRARFNSAGGNVGKLDNWGMPHAWSQKLLVKIGRDEYVNDMMGWVRREMYVHEDGRRFTDDQMREFLNHAWLTGATDGANKLKAEPVPGGAIKANRGSEHRQIHFKDGDAAVAAFRKYSDRNLFQVLTGHVRRMSGDIALIEQFSPNADHMFETLVNKYYQKAVTDNPGDLGALQDKVQDITNLYNYLAGSSPRGKDNWLAHAASDVRAILSAAKLGSATITSLADEGTLYLTAHVNRVSGMSVFLGELRGLNLLDQTEKRLAMRAGLMVKTMSEDIARFGSDTMGPRWSGKLSNFFMRLSGLNAMTEVRRRAFSAAMMDTIGHLTREVDLHQLDPGDYKFLVSKGITPEEWAIWRQAIPEDWGHASKVLTPESIMRVPGVDQLEKQKAATKLLSVVLEEQNNAVIEPGARERTDLNTDARAGTFKGELLRSIFLFKSFPHAMITRHIHRAIGAYDGLGGKVGYLASLVALQTVMGAVAIEINDILSGRDPRNLNPLEKHGMRNWIAAVLKGGALGVYGDFLFDEAGASGRSPVETMAGPVAGTVASAISLTQGNAVQYLRGDNTHAGAELARFLRGITPGSNLWYAKAVTDHLIFQNMQEFFSPGYLADVRAKAHRNAGTTWWWKPGGNMDNSFNLDDARAPDVSKILGVEQ